MENKQKMVQDPVEDYLTTKTRELMNNYIMLKKKVLINQRKELTEKSQKELARINDALDGLEFLRDKAYVKPLTTLLHMNLRELHIATPTPSFKIKVGDEKLQTDTELAVLNVIKEYMDLSQQDCAQDDRK